MASKRYSVTEHDFVYDWVDRWFQLITLIYDLIGTDEPPWSPPPPTDLDEISYQRLRLWFINHEAQFKPIWRDFYESQDWALHPGDDELVDMPDADKCIENPFFFYYHPENLYRLVQELDIQSGIDIWEPSRHRAWTVAVELLQIGKRVVEFFEWIDDRTQESDSVGVPLWLE